MGVAACHSGHRRADQLARRHRHRGRLMLVERLDHVAAAIGSGSGRAGRVYEADDVLERGDGVPMVD